MNILMDIFVNFNPSQELFEMMRDQLIKDYINQLKNPHNILRPIFKMMLDWLPPICRHRPVCSGTPQRPPSDSTFIIILKAYIREVYYYTFDTKRYSIVNKRKALKGATLQDLIDFTRELRENSYFKLHAEGNFHKSQIDELYQ